MTKVLLISDIHGDVKTMENILELHQDADVKIFLGDFQVSRVAQENLASLFDYVVQGNNDYPGISEKSILVDIDGVKTFMDHGTYYMTLIHYVDRKKLAVKAKSLGATLALHGHNHKAEISDIDGVTVFNPGSPSYPRFGSKAAYGVILIENGEITSIENIYI